MTPLGAALKYAVRGWPVFPCDAQKIPRTKHGFKDATTVERQVREWWSRWPYALIGMPTGERTGLAVLDVDMKNGKNGLRTLARLLGTDELPVTPTAHTQTGGLHLHFRRRERGFANTAGAGGRGIGEGLDWRCDGGYVIVPAPSSGYSWDPRQNYATCSPIDVPRCCCRTRPSNRETHPRVMATAALAWPRRPRSASPARCSSYCGPRSVNATRPFFGQPAGSPKPSRPVSSSRTTPTTSSRKPPPTPVSMTARLHERSRAPSGGPTGDSPHRERRC